VSSHEVHDDLGHEAHEDLKEFCFVTIVSFVANLRVLRGLTFVLFVA
jgi:hypothetical protein